MDNAHYSAMLALKYSPSLKWLEAFYDLSKNGISNMCDTKEEFLFKMLKLFLHRLLLKHDTLDLFVCYKKLNISDWLIPNLLMSSMPWWNFWWLISPEVTANIEDDVILETRKSASKMTKQTSLLPASITILITSLDEETDRVQQ